MLIIDFGTLIIESELQPKDVSLEVRTFLTIKCHTINRMSVVTRTCLFSFV